MLALLLLLCLTVVAPQCEGDSVTINFANIQNAGPNRYFIVNGGNLPANFVITADSLRYGMLARRTCYFNH